MFARQRVALLQVWKSFEEQHGTAEDIAKVEGMMPVQGKRRYVDEETGQLVEGTRLDPMLGLERNRTLMNLRRDRLRLHLCRRRARGEPDFIQVPSNGACMGSH